MQWLTLSTKIIKESWDISKFFRTVKQKLYFTDLLTQSETHSEPCQISKMECFPKMFSQNALSQMFNRVLNTSIALKWMRMYPQNDFFLKKNYEGEGHG